MRKQFVKKVECPLCGSSDANAIYDDGSSFCYSCNKPTTNKTDTSKITTNKEISKVKTNTKQIQIKDNLLAVRKIEQKTIEKYDVEFSSFGKDKVIIYNYFDKNHEKYAKKVRYLEKKDFLWQGETKNLMFGQQLYKSGGRQIIITEGEVDTLSISQVLNYNIPVVSISKGANGAKNEFLKHFDYLNSFKIITLAFDNDDAGRKAVEKVSNIFEPGKIEVVKFKDYKDANDYLVNDKIIELRQVLMNAETYRPDGIIDASELSIETLMTPIEKGLEYKFEKLQKLTYGIRDSEICLITAGSGIGKSTLVRQIAYDTRKEGNKVGMVFLEEDIKKTTQGFIALDNNVPLNKFRINPNIIPIEKAIRTKKELLDNGLYLYDHFGSLDSENLLNKIRYMRQVLKVDVLFLDHISIVVSGNKLTDERKELDIIMTKLRTITQETGLKIVAIIHLKRKNTGTDFNEGGQISLTDLRGSASLEQLADCVIGLERNQQSVDEGDILQLRVLKNREMGEVGLADLLKFNKQNGKLEPYKNNEEDIIESNKKNGYINTETFEYDNFEI